MEIAFSNQKNCISILFTPVTESTHGEMYLPLAGETMPPSWLFKSQVKDLATEPSLLWLRFFFVRSNSSFEQVRVPRVTENRYGANNKQRE